MEETERRTEIPDTVAMIKSKPVVTYAIMAICIVLAAIAMYLTPDPNTYIYSANMRVMTSLGAKANDLIFAGEYWRLLTSMFLHMGLVHLAFNMIFLYTIGPGVEGLFGKTRYTLIFLLSGLLGSAASFALTPAISAGASGALFGLLGAYLYFWSTHPQAGKQIGKAVLQLVIYNLVFGLVVQVVDNWAHLGGLIGGFLAASIVGLPAEGRKPAGGKRWLLAVGGLLAYTVLLAAGLWFGVVRAGVQRQLTQADYFLDRKDYAGAEQILLQAEKKQPNLADIHIRLGFTYLVQNDLPAAKSELEEAVLQNPDIPQSHYYLGYTYASLGQITEALAHLSEAVKLDPLKPEYTKALNMVKNGQSLP